MTYRYFVRAVPDLLPPTSFASSSSRVRISLYHRSLNDVESPVIHMEFVSEKIIPVRGFRSIADDAGCRANIAETLILYGLPSPMLLHVMANILTAAAERNDETGHIDVQVVDLSQRIHSLGSEDVGRTEQSVAAEVDGVERVVCGAGSDLVGKECVICITEFEVMDDLRKMPCQHVFHKECLITWLGIKRNCPLCRFALPETTNVSDWWATFWRYGAAIWRNSNIELLLMSVRYMASWPFRNCAWL